MGFDTVLLGWPFPVAERSWFATLTLARVRSDLGGAPPDEAFARLCDAARIAGLSLAVDLVCTTAGEGDLVRALPGCWAPGPFAGDPRVAPGAAGHAVRLDAPDDAERFAAFWAGQLELWRRAGVSAVRCHAPAALRPKVWDAILREARAQHLTAIAWTPGIARDTVAELAPAFDFVTASTAWWDGAAPWLVEEYNALKPHARVLGICDDPFGPRLATRVPAEAREPRHRLVLSAAALLADGWLMPMGFEHGAAGPFLGAAAPQLPQDACFDLSAEAVSVNAMGVDIRRLRQLTAPGAPLTLVLAQGAAETQMVALNSGSVPVDLAPADGAAARLALRPEGPLADALAPGGVARLALVPTLPVTTARRPATAAVAAPRIAIERVTPSVDDGRFAAKRCVGDVVSVEADIFADGHELLGAELRWRARDEKAWMRAPMVPTVNDRWQARFPLRRVGAHEFLIEAWWDRFGTFRRDLRKKRDAGRPLAVEVEEGRLLLVAALNCAGEASARVIRTHLAQMEEAPQEARVALLLSEPLAAAMADAEPRAFATGSERHFPLDCDREAARFASWYELFPRSVTDDVRRHGTFRDVIGRLPAIAAMGFDVVYFPPIHPIGRTHRKGRNNALTAAPGDPGSPYAIGAAEGGHEAIHPGLGTAADFAALVASARDLGVEIALDFAIQCSPDHPWMQAHPEWFQWRPDGTVRYAENPPKTYEDIVNVDFYADGAVPDLWIALRDVVESWVQRGVRLFRVDNPHTKPFPFWEWLIADIRSRDPGVIFLAEAFTRPKVMYRLGKVGFGQSYTYFTWRNTKSELIQYMEELNRAPARDIYRPHFFVNTPDINPYFLQRSGRPGFLIRAALAATLSGLWGLYSGFELCEAAPILGKEEYLDSEKYEIRVRDYTAPGNIIAQIRQLNAIRRAHPALQTHLGVSFYNAFDDQVLYFGKRLADEPGMVLVAVTLDPHGARNCAIEVPLWAFGLPDHAAVEVEDLVRERRFLWQGKVQTIRLDPADLPYAIWRIQPVGGAA